VLGTFGIRISFVLYSWLLNISSDRTALPKYLFDFSLFTFTISIDINFEALEFNDIVTTLI